MKVRYAALIDAEIPDGMSVVDVNLLLEERLLGTVADVKFEKIDIREVPRV